MHILSFETVPPTVFMVHHLDTGDQESDYPLLRMVELKNQQHMETSEAFALIKTLLTSKLKIAPVEII